MTDRSGAAGRGLPADGFAAVLDAARGGDQRAWTRLYDAYAGLVLGYLRGRGAVDAEDLTGEVFVKVVASLETFGGGEADFRSWLLTVTHHTMIDDWRRRGRRPEDPTPRSELVAAGPSELSEPRAVEQLTTEEVVGLLDVLTVDQREVLAMRLVSGLSTREIARATGRTRGAVKQLQRRAIARLRDLVTSDAYPLSVRGR